jgi:hypothetical protein
MKNFGRKEKTKKVLLLSTLSFSHQFLEEIQEENTTAQV